MLQSCGGIFDFEAKQKRLAEVVKLAEDPAVWSDNKRAQDLGRERKSLDAIVSTLTRLDSNIRDAHELFEITRAEQDDTVLAGLGHDAEALEQVVSDMEFRRMFANPADPNNCFLDIQAGSGGTEAQDWAAMLERMYLRYCERKGFKVELLEESPGEVAGIKSATLKVNGDYAYGHPRTETGIHRLVRKSPFDANNRRHTSFASVFVIPEIADDIQVVINESDLRIETFRAGGHGGQHVNVTDSAVRIIHLPTGIVAQCQNERSQHKNRASAMKVVRSRLYELEQEKQAEKLEQYTSTKKDIAWGHQIRSYVLHPYRLVKDHRTDLEVGNVDAVLDGELDPFIEQYLLTTR